MIFGRKKVEGGAAAGAGAGAQPAESFDPDKAARFFQHARTVHDTTNYEYAMTLWLQGLRLDPASVTALESFFNSAAQFLAVNKKGPTKDQLAAFDGKTDASRFALALLNWGCKPLESAAAVKAVEAAAKIKAAESAYWLGQRAINITLQDPKAKKDAFIKLKDALVEVGAYDLAVKAGNAALNLDRSDSALDAEIRNLAAQAAMTQGGYEKTGEQGGFRANIRDAETQRRLEEEQRAVKSEDVAARVLEAAKADYEKRPSDTAAIDRYVKALLENGGDENEKAAYELLMKTYEATREFRYRKDAGALVLRRARRRLSALQARAKANPADEKAVAELRDFERKLVEKEAEELALAAEAYPTDLSFRYELGKRYLRLGRHEDAIANFQASQNDAKVRTMSLGYLGACFLHLKLYEEAVQSYREALESHPTHRDELGMDLRYGLMVALQTKGQESRNLADAEESLRLASGLVMQQINFKDVRQRRDAIQALVQQLKG